MGLQAQRSSGISPQHPDSAPPPRKMCSAQSSLTQSTVKILYPAACSLLTEFPHRCILVVSAILILKTLPAKWQKQNYTWLSSTSTTTTTVLLASVPAGGLANVPKLPNISRSDKHPESPQSAQLERNITSKTESWMPFFVGTKLCSDETFAATKAHYSVPHKIQEWLQRADLVQCSHSASSPGVP